MLLLIHMYALVFNYTIFMQYSGNYLVFVWCDMRMSEHQKLGRRIRQERRWASVSATDLGELLGISMVEVIKMEKGLVPVTAVMLNLISRILNVPLSDFFDEQPCAKDGRPVIVET